MDYTYVIILDNGDTVERKDLCEVLCFLRKYYNLDDIRGEIVSNTEYRFFKYINDEKSYYATVKKGRKNV